MSIPKLTALLLFITGIVISLYSLAEYCCASIPFQDASNDMLLQQQMELDAAKVRLLFGIELFFPAFCFAFFRTLSHKRQPNSGHGVVATGTKSENILE